MVKDHLGYYKKKWNGRLRGRFESKLQLRGLLFMTLWCNTYYGMDQMNRILSQMMTLADAATTAARTSSSVMEKTENRKDGGGFSRASKILRPPAWMNPASSWASPVKEMAKKLYAILASYIKGPASQIVRAAAGERNGLLVWQQLRDLYIPRARPRTMAIGQAIMSYPSFQAGKSMLENLLQLDLLLNQYQLASGHAMPGHGSSLRHP